MSLTIPNTLANKSGQVQLGLLDENFTYLATQVDAANITISNLTLSTISGSLPISKGSTGLASPGAAGGILISDGLAWTTSILTGAVCYFAMNTPPAGWLKANGAAISRTTYAALFAAIGTAYGIGDGSTTFNIPDLRGEFLRAWDDSRGVDIGRVNGSAQAQDWKSFTMTDTGQNTTAYVHIDVYMGKSTTAYIGNLFTGYWSAPAAAIGTKWDTSEIRPRNVALMVCIKY